MQKSIATTNGFFSRARSIFFLGVLSFFSSFCGIQGQQPIDNSGFIPKLLPDTQVKMEGASPDWVKTLIMAEIRIETATPEGTFASATKVLDHYAEMGVNGLWVDPIYDRGPSENGYGNLGPETIYPALLTGTKNTSDPFHEVKKFVDEAHKRNIRILFDIIVWGTNMNAPLVSAHPEFYSRKNGDFVKVWGGYEFNWQSQELRSWFKNAAVNLIEKTGADGFRVDLAPDSSGYYFKEIRDALYARGRKIIIVSECVSSRRDTFDFEQTGVTAWTEKHDYAHPDHHKEQQQRFGLRSEYLFHNNLVDIIHTGKGIGDVKMQQEGKGGTFRFYTSTLLDHDDPAPFAAGNRVRFAYSTLFAPFIPMWWIGEEWNNPKVWLPKTGGVMYGNRIDWTQIPANQAFYEDAKKYIRIRRSYPEIFEYFPENARHANLAKLDTTKDGAPNPLQAYARFTKGKAVLIVPNEESKGSANFQIKLDDAVLGLDPFSSYKITDLMTGQVLTPNAGPSFGSKSFTAKIEAEHLGLYLLMKP
jgi:hypothetical protein